jgi:outer membrane protein assembly factor BamA
MVFFTRFIMLAIFLMIPFSKSFSQEERLKLHCDVKDSESIFNEFDLSLANQAERSISLKSPFYESTVASQVEELEENLWNIDIKFTIKKNNAVEKQKKTLRIKYGGQKYLSPILVLFSDGYRIDMSCHFVKKAL